MEPGTKRIGGGRAYHSILEPHCDFIRALRRTRRTWKEIAEALAHEKGVRVTLQGDYLYYRRWTRRQREIHWEDLETSTEPAVEAPTDRSRRLPPTFPESGFRKPNRDSFQKEDYL